MKKVEIIFIVKRIWRLHEGETIQSVKNMLEDEAGEYLYGGSDGERNEKIEVDVKEVNVRNRKRDKI